MEQLDIDSESAWEPAEWDEQAPLWGKGARTGLPRWAVWCAGLAVGCIVSGILGWALHQPVLPASPPIVSAPQMPPSTPSVSNNSIAVDVHGDVRKPGVIHLGDQARVQDAIQAAGGYVHPQDAQMVNAAALVTDGEEIVVPGPTVSSGGLPARDSLGQTGATSSLQQTPPSAHGPAIDLNTANLTTLETLPDIGPTRASRILMYRQAHGPFGSVADLRNVHGIGPTIFSRIAPYLYVGSLSS